VSYLRTVIPVLWGSLIALLVSTWTWLPAVVVDWLSGETAVAVVTAAAIAVWYWAWRWLESRPWTPDWLTRLALGSAQTPVYFGPPNPADEAEADAQAEGNDRRLDPYV
jgi:hypothetical protein